MKDRQRLLVIGNGMAGARAVEEILARGGGERLDITMFGDEPYGNYNRILLSNVLNGAQDLHDIFLNPLDWYAENGITLHAGVRVTRIDRDCKSLRDDRGRSFAYDKLIIATGSRPFVPPIDGLESVEGAGKPGVFVFRTIDDCARIAGYADKCRKAVVIGGGLLGLEAARGLMNYGVEVHVVHNVGWLMNNQLDQDGGAVLKAAMERMGVQVHLDTSIVRVLGAESVRGVAFRTGDALDCDMVVISAGITPNTEIARECGLAVERAIVVNDRMQSIGDPDIYVVGECAQ
ncbi:MAG TPA: FAD-dependent oxidoreductase, partial [Chthonomonadaceae bacterium]|nr:FAD-dependent oxidoreductase [Chthonomonadaceae bacterium]